MGLKASRVVCLLLACLLFDPGDRGRINSVHINCYGIGEDNSLQEKSCYLLQYNYIIVLCSLIITDFPKNIVSFSLHN
jgi:hypothetical protein